jgi:hypothetical protein
VAETFWDADGSNGAFLTEKTFKAIRAGQPFVIAGTAHSLQTLRDLGYRVYDSCVDTHYDRVQDNTERFRSLIGTIAQLQTQDLRAWSLRAQEDATWNQDHFLASKADRIHTLIQDLNLNV